MYDYTSQEGNSMYDWHDKTLNEEQNSIIGSLGGNGARIIDIVKTKNGNRHTECCDYYFGITLSQTQMDRFIVELQELTKP